MTAGARGGGGGRRRGGEKQLIKQVKSAGKSFKLMRNEF